MITDKQHWSEKIRYLLNFGVILMVLTADVSLTRLQQ